MLHITNGDSVVQLLQQTNLEGDIIAWRDILFEGPILNKSLPEHSLVRCEYLVAQGYGSYAKIHQDFMQRDERFVHSLDDDEVVLWFEYDVYDQLQLIQILNWYACQHNTPQKLSLICINDFPGVEKFFGLGQLNPEQLMSLFPKRKQVSMQELILAKEIWMALYQVTPKNVASLLHQDLSYLPYAHNALRRLLQQYPHPKTGLNRVQQFILSQLVKKPMTIRQLFARFTESENELFLGMGDVTFLKHIKKMLIATKPVIRSRRNPHNLVMDITLALTPIGKKILGQENNYIELNGIDVYIGGVHNTTTDFWTYDDRQRLVQHHA